MNVPAARPRVYDATKAFVKLVAHLFFRVEISFAGHVPEAGGFVLAPVHRSYLDPPLVSLVTSRRLSFLAKSSLFRHVVLHTYLPALGAFPVERGTPDLSAFRQSLAVLKGGNGLVMFPEGTRGHGNTVGELEDGVCRIARRAGVPVIPVGIEGAEKAFGPGARLPRLVKIRMLVGEPVPPEDASTELLRERLQEMLTTLVRQKTPA